MLKKCVVDTLEYLNRFGVFKAITHTMSFTMVEYFRVMQAVAKANSVFPIPDLVSVYNVKSKASGLNGTFYDPAICVVPITEPLILGICRQWRDCGRYGNFTCR